jgi:hypothetical protein
MHHLPSEEVDLVSSRCWKKEFCDEGLGDYFTMRLRTATLCVAVFVAAESN